MSKRLALRLGDVQRTSGLSLTSTEADLGVEMEETATPPHTDDKREATTLTPSMQGLDLKTDNINHAGSVYSEDSKSKSSSPATTPSQDVKHPRKGPQLIAHLPRAEAEALRTFVQIFDNRYFHNSLGRSREALESMTCDCVYEPGVDDPISACGHGSDCINRLTQVECMSDDCKCRSYCQNQRFQRKQHAELEIVLTEKKGYGLRTGTDLKRDAFIYEYIGEVLNLHAFKKRMRDYADEGKQHFYFMMLQKDEFIDATRLGGIGRFANHSCNPNCYVARWIVGEHVRMGIFASRNIKKDEELTFNYNVDRYGHDPQPCYCGEPKCLGFIGGKTQTDIGAMDDLYLDALGISDDVELLELKGSKKKKSKKLDEDWTPTLRPILEKEVPKVIQAMRQTQSRKVLFKLLTRLKLTEDQAPLRQVMRLRGFSLMTNVLEDYVKDLEITALVLECLATWPLLQRNKVDDSKITAPVEACSQSDNEVIKVLARKLLDYWDTLEAGYRIPKRLKQEGAEEETKPSFIVPEEEGQEARPSKRSRYDELFKYQGIFVPAKLELKPSVVVTPPVIRSTSQTQIEQTPPTPANRQPTRQDIALIIAAASAAAAAAKPPPPTETDVESASPSKEKGPPKHPKKSQTKEEKETNKEKRLLKLVGPVVVKCMSKYQKQLDHDLFKKHAKELTHIIAEKEKKSSSYKDGRLETLSDEKVAKIKKFAKEYIAKILRKLDKTGHRSKALPSVSSNTTGSADGPTPDDGDVAPLGMEEGMDMDGESDHESRKDDDAEMSGEELADQTMDSLPPEIDALPTSSPVDAQHFPVPDTEACDPRSRPPNGVLPSGFAPIDGEGDRIGFPSQAQSLLEGPSMA